MESALLEKFSQLWMWLLRPWFSGEPGGGFGDLRGLFQPQQFRDSPPLQRDLRVPLTGSFWPCEDWRTSFSVSLKFGLK